MFAYFHRWLVSRFGLAVRRQAGKQRDLGLNPLRLSCHHQNDSCIKTGSDESHFNVSFIVRDKVTRRYPQTTSLEEKGEPKRVLTEVCLLTSLTTYR